ncbi:DUF4349 domain-containing protein [Nitrospirillum sp. BR 11752]|uniref:DUF4349 domain-containing protein n=1 Tax=Nitrospirillum sp. BR 11752 TaxID=3104293 RepID=UPI002EA91CFA|nr:DUF4349 domain-containing protein [Nitrospirillum sp. BR 11752]
MGRTGWGLVLTAVALMALAGCKKKDEVVYNGQITELAPPPFVPPVEVPIGALPMDMAARKYVAVSHVYTVKLPAAAVEATQQRHLDTCAKLNCFILKSTLDRISDGSIKATTELRLPPQGMEAFTKDLTAPPVEVTAHSRTAEDKTLAVLDVDKRLETKSALRERLTTLLHSTTSKSVHDLLELEQQIAEVQGDIESTTAQRDHLRTVTDTVDITINYNGEAPAKAPQAGLNWGPIRDAVKEFGQTLIGSVATLVDFVAIILPWLPLVLLAAWLLRRFARRLRRGRHPGNKPPMETTPA